MSVGIHSLGLYVPPDVRNNEWWPQELVARWAQQRRSPPLPSITASTEGARRVVAASAEQAADPFLGTVERRVLAAGRSIGDMELVAARDAIARAGMSANDIDLLLVHPVVPDHQLVNPACALHEQLGLAPTCLSLGVEATAYTSLAQMAIAEAMIDNDRARNALLVQSCLGSRLVPREEPNSVLVGDGATAIVMGTVASGRGVLSSAHFTEGKYPDSLIMSVRGGRWYDDGPARMYVRDSAQLYTAHLRIADSCAEAVHAALAKTTYRIEDVDFLCVFQGTPWIQQVVYEQLGVRHLVPFPIFHQYGYLSSAMIPAALFRAEQDRKLSPGDLVVIVGGGTGMTYGATVLRWGVT